VTPRSTSLQTMDKNEILARFGLVPHVEDLPKIRALLLTEAVDKNRDSNEPLKTVCIQLFSAGEPSDSLLIQSQDVLIRCRMLH
jgi:hypothetical protein